MKRKKLNVQNVEQNFSVNLKIDYCSYQAAKFAVEHWHYSKSMPAGKLFKCGVWENNNFIGCIIYSMGANKNMSKEFKLNYNDVCELARVALNKHINPVSKLISYSIKLLYKNNSKLKLIVTYADSNKNHLGKIYKAGNWI